jgi:hypothetical protein
MPGGGHVSLVVFVAAAWLGTVGLWPLPLASHHGPLAGLDIAAHVIGAGVLIADLAHRSSRRPHR